MFHMRAMHLGDVETPTQGQSDNELYKNVFGKLIVILQSEQKMWTSSALCMHFQQCLKICGYFLIKYASLNLLAHNMNML